MASMQIESNIERTPEHVFTGLVGDRLIAPVCHERNVHGIPYADKRKWNCPDKTGLSLKLRAELLISGVN